MHECIKAKAAILYDFKLTDTKAVEEYLEKKCEGLTDYNAICRRVDCEAHKLIEDFYNGDKHFVKKSAKKDNDDKENMKPLTLYAKLKRTYPDHKVVTRSEIIAVTGERGFNGIQSAKYIKRAGTIGKEKVYKFNR